VRRSLTRASLAALALLPLLACPEPPNQLEGSIDEMYDLSFESVQIRTYESTGELQIQYLRKTEDGSDQDVVAQITVTRPSGGFPKDTDIKFDQVNGKVHRIVGGGDDFPAVLSGLISFSAGGNAVDEQTTGEFSVIFQDARGDEGYTLRGRFDGKLELATAG
jgi:hypothetical protein